MKLSLKLVQCLQIVIFKEITFKRFIGKTKNLNIFKQGIKMEENEEVVNIYFFKKVWYSISKFEQYPAMATEGLWRAIKYLTTLTIIVTIFLMIGSLLKIKT